MRVALLLACAPAFANEPPGKAGAAADTVLPAVAVSALRDPVDKSYRKMLQGMDLFEAKHGMAPNATLRYKLLPRQRDTNMQGIALTVVGDSVAIPVALAPDDTFTLDRHQNALDEDASVMPNRKAGSMTWRTEIRTPGLPPNTRRLGDLRLECMVGIEAELVSNSRPIIGRIADFIARLVDYCNSRDTQYLFFAEHPLFSVTLIAAGRREVVSVDRLYAGASHDPGLAADLPYCDCQVLLARTYFLPLGDASWPDDTLVEYEYMADETDRSAAAATILSGASETISAGKSTKADVMAALGKTSVVSFDSGFEVWVYQYNGGERIARTGSEKTAAGNAEFVILFAPSGVVAKTRIRPASLPGGTKGS